MSYNLSSSPHVRSWISTRTIMYDVIIALLPAVGFGIWRFGLYSALILAVSVGFAVLAEYTYQKLTGQKVLISDGSAVLTGLLLGLNMPPTIPLWIPALGSMFAIIVVKQIFGGLGHNFMNPALGGRCFLLISFTGLMSTFAVDGVTGPTPLALLKGGSKVDVAAMFVGFTGGVIGEVSVIAILIGGIYLLVKKVISWEIPVTYIVSFLIFLILFGGQGVNPEFLLAHLCGGGLMLGAFFMATDYVTSPITRNGKFLFAILLGILTGVFRIFGPAAEGVSYAIIIGNLLVPLIEKVTMPKAFGLEKKGSAIPAAAYKAAYTLCGITLIAGLLLGVVYQITKEPIRKAEEAAAAAAYVSVCPQADHFEAADEIMANADAVSNVYGASVVDAAYHALDKDGNINGYVVNVTNKEGFGGELTVSVGFDETGIITGLEFLTIQETAGLGMNATDETWRAQYIGKAVEEFTVTKTGAGSDAEIDALSGATITSNAVTNAVNTAKAAVASIKE